MFKLETEHWGEVEISFRHVKPGDAMTSFPSFGTWCAIKNSDKNALEITAVGSTQLSWLDRNKYCKEFGRKLALSRALANLKATREERTLFWKAYFEKKHQDRERALTRAIYIEQN